MPNIVTGPPAIDVELHTPCAPIILTCPEGFGRDSGTLWQLRHVTESWSGTGKAENAVYLDATTRVWRAYGVKLTKKGTPLSGRPHLLFWLHGWEDLPTS